MLVAVDVIGRGLPNLLEAIELTGDDLFGGVGTGQVQQTAGHDPAQPAAMALTHRPGAGQIQVQAHANASAQVAQPWGMRLPVWRTNHGAGGADAPPPGQSGNGP
jgi:hypothetical protein